MKQELKYRPWREDYVGDGAYKKLKKLIKENYKHEDLENECHENFGDIEGIFSSGIDRGYSYAMLNVAEILGIDLNN